MGQYLKKGLEELKQKHACISEIRGLGLLLAIEFNSDIAQPLTMACLENGLLVNKLKDNALRFMPPLIITKNDVDETLAILDKALGTNG